VADKYVTSLGLFLAAVRATLDKPGSELGAGDSIVAYQVRVFG